MRRVVYRSMPGMIAICSNDGLATTAYRSHVPQACALCGSVPFVYDKLPDISRTPSPDLPTDHISNVQERFKVRRTDRLRQNIHSVSLQKRHSSAGRMAGDTILHQAHIPVTQITMYTVQIHIRSSNLFLNSG